MSHTPPTRRRHGRLLAAVLLAGLTVVAAAPTFAAPGDVAHGRPDHPPHPGPPPHPRPPKPPHPPGPKPTSTAPTSTKPTSKTPTTTSPSGTTTSPEPTDGTGTIPGTTSPEPTDGTGTIPGTTSEPPVQGGTPCVAGVRSSTPIPDQSTIKSTLAMANCAGNASAASTVTVKILHPYSGDLIVSLVAPDGSVYVLRNRQGGSADNIDMVFGPLNLSSEMANGTWTLSVQDAAATDSGTLDSWSLNLSGSAVTSCTGSSTLDATIPDPGTVTQTLTLSSAGCTGTASATSQVTVDIVHTYRGDLLVTLLAPDGSTYILANRSGGSADNIQETFTLDLSTESRAGTWSLRVQDASARDTGFINGWMLSL